MFGPHADSDLNVTVRGTKEKPSGGGCTAGEKAIGGTVPSERSQLPAAHG